jgi:DDE superfamily endonuclease
MILLYVMRGHTNRETAERWQHSGSTISEVAHEVSVCLASIKHLIYKPAREGDPVPSQIANFAKFSPFFDDCIGALDGTHIPAVVKPEEIVRFTNRKKFVSQNVLGVANFDLTFAYALYGWEGSAHDSRVVDDAKVKGLPLIPDKYYLGDGGYGLKKHILTPYRGERINVIEFNLNGQGPVNKRELFNRRHASLRNTVERLFGVVKRRFPILTKMTPYAFEFQCDIVQCCFHLHNFIRLNQLYEDEFYDDEGNVPNDVVDDENDDEDENGPEMNALKAWRNYAVSRLQNLCICFCVAGKIIAEIAALRVSESCHFPGWTSYPKKVTTSVPIQDFFIFRTRPLS